MVSPQSSFVTSAEIATAFSIKPSTLRAWVRDRKVDFYRIEGTVRFDRTILDPNWVDHANASDGPWQPKTDAAALLQVSVRTLEIWFTAGLLPVTARYGRTVRVHLPQLRELLRRKFFFPKL